MSQAHWVGLGHISGVYGVRGWVRVFSSTLPREQILTYRPWYLGRPDELPAADAAPVTATGRQQGKGIVAALEGVDDRDAAAQLIGYGIYVPREALPRTAPGQYYWTDLVGLAVRTRSGEALGSVVRLMETGVHDVLVLDGGADRLIPFVPGAVVVDVDLRAGVITVEWDSAWWE